jgi:isopentenyl-diphosphate Delta-isomerase
MSSHQSRKGDHLDLCATDDVAFQAKTTLFDQVQLVHDALPELAFSEINLKTELCGKTLSAPVVIAAMTGGVERAEQVNRDLASVAQEHGIAFGFGSMRPLLEQGLRHGYFVRDEAPDALIFGNIGVVQAGQASSEALAELVGTTSCDALVVHLNPAMELIQRGGDEDFRGGLDTICRLADELPVPIVVKETGCGLSRAIGIRLEKCGISHVDVSGAGGTSWVGVESLRGKSHSRSMGEVFWDWGIPTAASVAQLSGLNLNIIATGGIRHGLDIARGIALGAQAGGLARPFLKALNEGGRVAASRMAVQITREIAMAHLLTGSRTPKDLRQKPVVIGPQLERWLPADSPIRQRRLD